MEQMIDTVRKAVEGVRHEFSPETQEALTLILGALDILADKRGEERHLAVFVWCMDLDSAVRLINKHRS